MIEARSPDAVNSEHDGKGSVGTTTGAELRIASRSHEKTGGGVTTAPEADGRIWIACTKQNGHRL